MKRLLLSLIWLLSFLISFGQSAPDNEQILRGIIDGNSKFYYPSIYGRYMIGDATLTQDDYYYLYYGYAYDDKYNPLESISAEAKVLSVLESEIEGDTLKARELLKYCHEVMESDPFSPKNINFMIYAYTVLGDAVNAQINADRLEKIVQAIKASGNGLREKTPWHVLWFSHAADVIASMDIVMGKRQVVTRTVEYISLLEKKDGIKGYYFDFGRMYWKKPKNTEHIRRGTSLNGIRLN